MVDSSTPETADEEAPDADDGEGEPEGVADATAEQAGDSEGSSEAVTEVEEGNAEVEEGDAHDGDATPGTSAPDVDAEEPGTEERVAASENSSGDGPSAAAADVPESDESAGEDSAGERAASDVPGPDLSEDGSDATDDVPADVRKYERFKKMDGAEYDRVNEFLRDRTYVTAREWAIARLCADFRTETGVEMTKIGQNLPRLIPFMTDTYTPQAVNQARSSFEEKVNKAGATFLYGAMSGFFTAEELDEMMYEVTEIAKFLLEVEGVDLSVEEELAAEDKISEVMREVRQSSAQVRGEEVKCPECGHVHDA